MAGIYDYTYNPLTLILQRNLPEVFDDSLSYGESIANLLSRINDVGLHLNEAIMELMNKENSSNISTARKLSATGNFTGTLNGRSIAAIFADIANSATLASELIALINSGGVVSHIIDGGIVENGVVIENYYDGGIIDNG